jgi:hypothetical protein
MCGSGLDGYFSLYWSVRVRDTAVYVVEVSAALLIEAASVSTYR